MKTNLFESIRKKAFYLMLGIAMTAGFASCSTEEVTEDDDITGSYIGGSEDTGDILIKISKNSSGYSFYCRYEDWSPANSRLNLQTSEWNGTFANIPSDVIKDSKGEEIGEIELTKSKEFTSYTAPKGRYTAKKGGELTDVNL